jgi:hypothetical protein
MVQFSPERKKHVNERSRSRDKYTKDKERKPDARRRLSLRAQFGGESGSVLINSRFSARLSVSHLALKCNCRFNQLENKREAFTFLSGRRRRRERIR